MNEERVLVAKKIKVILLKDILRYFTYVSEFNFCLCFEWLQSFELELLVVLFHDGVLCKVNGMVAPFQLSAVIVNILAQVASEVRQMFNEVLARIIKSDEHAIKYHIRNLERVRTYI